LDPARLGPSPDPAVKDIIATGVDLVAFSGDKLLGGPQAGVLAGGVDAIARCREHPLLRALRPDKLTLAALVGTLALYRQGRARDVPVLAMLSAPADELRRRALALVAACGVEARPYVSVVETISAIGGGASTREMPSWGVALDGPGDADALARALREAPIPVIAHIVNDRVILDVRTILPPDEDAVVAAVRLAIAR